MPSQTTRKGPLVRGLCPAGHLVETRAAHGRITWKGPCPHELPNGKRCGLHLIARRTAEQPEPHTGPLEPAPPDTGTPAPVRKVASYVDHGIDPNRPDEPGFSDPADPDDAGDGSDDSGKPGVPPPEDPPGPGSTGPVADHDPPARPPRSRLRRAWDRWRAPGLDLDGPEDDWTIPGIYP